MAAALEACAHVLLEVKNVAGVCFFTEAPDWYRAYYLVEFSFLCYPLFRRAPLPGAG